MAARGLYAALAEKGDLCCVWTGRPLTKPKLAVDHVLPWARFHSNDLWNLMPALACFKCAAFALPLFLLAGCTGSSDADDAAPDAQAGSPLYLRGDMNDYGVAGNFRLKQLDRKFAVPVYCGMMTDTGGFTFASNAPEIFFIICQLLTKGIDKDRIYRNVYNVFSEHRLRLQGYVLYKKMNVVDNLHASYFTLTRDDLQRFQYTKGDSEGLVNMPLQIKDMRLSISLREDTERDNLILVSLRSVDDFPCNEMAARFFNGGGHKNASGGRLFCGMEEAEEITRKAIHAYSGLLK